jgi:SAM-dependent methyltransferase
LPALLAWAAGWAGLFGALQLGAGALVAWACGCGLAVLLATRCRGGWRRGIAALGFPLSALATGWAGAPPAWAWGLAALPLLLLYPLRAWRDAPFFPTPGGGLQGLQSALCGPAPRRVLDAGCGMGHGLRELQRLWPQATVHGLEWSRPLAWAAARRCPRAQVLRGDMWAASWHGHDLVYLFQRPESMARAWAKACAELAPGSWMVSLEFAVPGVQPSACLAEGRQRPVWLYRVPQSGSQ